MIFRGNIRDIICNMTWKEINSWAKTWGYKTSKAKDGYAWYKIDNPDECGVAPSVSKLARAIFNHMTNFKWIEHQNNFTH